MSDFLTFRRMVTPVIIQILFWIGVAITVIAGLVLIFVGGPNMSGGQAVLSGIVTVVLGPIFVRIYAELLIILFRINETLTDISNQLSEGARPGTQP